MKTKIALSLIVLFLNSKQPVFAQGVTVLGVIDCGQWVSHSKQSTAHRSWLTGYMSGLSRMHQLNGNKGDPLERLNSSEQLFLWMDNYCQKNPLERVSTGGIDLFIELMK